MFVHACTENSAWVGYVVENLTLNNILIETEFIISYSMATQRSTITKISKLKYKKHDGQTKCNGLLVAD